MRAMVLAAGLGTRLRPVTYSLPKPMVPVVNRPVMEHIVRLLASHDLTEIVANLHWFPDTIESHFGDGSEFGVSITYSREAELLGTAGGVREVEDFLGDEFLVISGDALTDIDLSAMREFHESHDGIATLATLRVRDTSEFGVVITDEDGRVQGFQEKPDPAEALSDLANCGIYMFDSTIFDHFPGPAESRLGGPDDPDGFADWAFDIFPALLEAGVPFYALEVDAYWNDIGTIPELLSGNFGALEGKVELVFDGAERSPGVWAPESLALDGIEFESPVLVGEDCSIGEGAFLEGPLVLGPGSVVGEGARVVRSVLTEAAEVPAQGFAVGAVLGKNVDS